MMHRFWHWVFRKTNQARMVQQLRDRDAAPTKPQSPSFDGGLSFTLHDVENGKVLQVFDHSAANHTNPHVGGMLGHQQPVMRTWIINHDENVIEFITRALVEERIK